METPAPKYSLLPLARDKGGVSEEPLRYLRVKTNNFRIQPLTLEAMFEKAERFTSQMNFLQMWLLGVNAGSLITFGAALSVMLSTGVPWLGFQRLLTSLGFVAGFSAVIFSGSVLFTEVAVLAPLHALGRRRVGWKTIHLVVAAFLGNLAGALLVSSMMRGAEVFTPVDELRLQAIINEKLRLAGGDAGDWFRILLSAILGNWLVGLAAFFATMATTTIGRLIGVFFPVVAFVVLGVQHTPANMGYLHLALIACDTCDISWGDAYAWNFIPAGIGNFLGGTIFVALLYWVAFVAFIPPNSTVLVNPPAAGLELQYHKGRVIEGVSYLSVMKQS
eukprot:CAMPEP_0119138188 /NCGR_PEP_ID=MMETSP1310-20130426/25176_1 /TAXON_ID=464262 /ORGANISM="Genus nov. species nov., Strain RCC2339" /LENGTH=332 /DNA_ID=CAMNT_0007129347 /DNA_START=212 /DNA_END=1210 /DNA_ORIENTATION=+